jgi:diguanylate cyclase (GGDEF)-like protein
MAAALPSRQGLPMRLVGRIALLVVCLYAVVAAAYSVSFLNGIERDARTTREEQIPLIMSQNRNALKVERAASLIRSVYLAHDRRLERQIQLQLQTLCQSFTLDENKTLSEGGRDIAAAVKQIVRGRETARTLREDLTSGDGTGADPDLDAQIKAADAASAESYQHAIHTADRLSDTLATDAIALSDSMASTIGNAAREVKFGWTLILTLPVLFLVLTLWVVSRHVMVPIGAAISRLEAISSGHAQDNPAKPPVFHELATIAGAVEAYGALSTDLTRTNRLLKILSDHDGLTGLANRRSLEKILEDGFATARQGGPEIGVMMIDIDHFKVINDTYGHITGDKCLVAVGQVLREAGARERLEIGRYGGEEFMAVAHDIDANTALEVAERIRMTIMGLNVHAEDGRPIPMTASIGLASLEGRALQGVDKLVAEADAALYQAKREGRNRVCAARAAKLLPSQRNRQG